MEQWLTDYLSRMDPLTFAIVVFAVMKFRTLAKELRQHMMREEERMSLIEERFIMHLEGSRLHSSADEVDD